MAAYRDLGNLALREVLPPSIRDDSTIRAVADALDPESQDIYLQITNLPYHPNLDNLPSRVIDLLAWQYHVDFYDAGADIAVRRARVASAITDHMLHGTREGVSRALETVFGAGNFTIVEWHEVDPGRPVHTYRVRIHAPFVSADIAEMRSVLRIAAPARSHLQTYIIWDELDALGLTWDELDALGLDWDQVDEWLIWAEA